MTPLCLSLPDAVQFGEALASALGAAHEPIELHRFPDGESRVRLGRSCADRNVILVQGGRDPDRGALPLCFAAQEARASGAHRIGLVSPYLPYMRQDTSFREGEAVSALAYARFLSASVDWIATVDPHLHRIHSLDEIYPIPALCVSSVSAIAAWIASNVGAPVIVGPDAESRQWVESVARRLSAPWTVLAKNRTGDRQVAVSLPDPGLLRGRSAVIVDDIASSGHTLAEAARVLRNLGSSTVTCVVVHALLAEEAESVIQAAGVGRLVTTNTLAHPTNSIDIVPLLAAGILAMREGAGVGSGAFRERTTEP